MPSRKQDPFSRQIEIALDHYNDPKWLGLHSPLAMPSFLGEYLLRFCEKTGVNSILPVERGRILQKMLRESADLLWGAGLPEDVHILESMVNDELNVHPATQSYRLSYLLLELKYFRSYFHADMYPPDIWVDIKAYLGFGGKGPFVKLTKTARQRFADQLLNYVKPAFRLEQPYQKTCIVGRDASLEQCQTALLEQKSVMLSGNGGVGKTTLGMAIGKVWETPVFWYTFRTGLNDNLSALLFALGFFFQKYAQSFLWTYLVAQNDHHPDDAQSNVDHALALGLLLDDLHRQPALPLICFDEIDLLEREGLDRISPEYALLIEFVEAIRVQNCPLLLIGQKPTIGADLFIELDGLSQVNVEHLLNKAYFVVESTQMQEVMAYTQGNPRLVELLIASSQEKRSLSDTLANLPKLHSVRSLLIRLWKHLSKLERSIVGLLTVFLKPISPQASKMLSDKDILSNLVKRHLVKQDEVGDLFILDTYQASIYDMLSAEEREKHHLEASHIRHNLGEFSAAAYHAVLAEEYVQAIKLFHPYIELECRRGNATSALNTFQSVSINRVSGKDNQHKLREIRMLLARRLGRADDIIREQQNLLELPNRNDINDLHNSATFHSQIAVGHYMNGDFESASDSYQKALDLLARVTNLSVRNIRQMIQTQYHIHGINAASPALHEAEYQLKRLQGFIFSRSGESDKAKDILNDALIIAENTSNDANIAFVCRELMFVHRRDLHKAQQFGQRAIDIHQRMGNLLSVSHIQAELGIAHELQEQYDEAIKLLEESLSSFKRFRSLDWLLTVKTNLAHCYLATDRIDEAHAFATSVLREENRMLEPYVRLTLGKIEKLNRKIEQAETHFKVGIDIADANGDQECHAYLERALGRFYCEQGKQKEGLDKLFSALGTFSKLKLLKECTETQKAIEFCTQSGE